MTKSHVDVVADVRGAVRLLLQDPLLKDLNSDITPDEISSQLALLQGHAFTLSLGTYHNRTICEKDNYTKFCPTNTLSLPLYSGVGSTRLYCARLEAGSGEKCVQRDYVIHDHQLVGFDMRSLFSHVLLFCDINCILGAMCGGHTGWPVDRYDWKTILQD